MTDPKGSQDESAEYQKPEIAVVARRVHRGRPGPSIDVEGPCDGETAGDAPLLRRQLLRKPGVRVEDRTKVRSLPATAAQVLPRRPALHSLASVAVARVRAVSALTVGVPRFDPDARRGRMDLAEP